MKRLLVCLWIMSALPGCQLTEKVAVHPNALFPGYYREEHDIPFYTDRGSVSHPDRLEEIIFFDIDGDGTDEALCTTYSETWRSGSIWRVFYYEDGGWRTPKMRGIVTYTHPSNFYYRVGAKRQPRLFVADNESKGPAAIVRADDAERFIATPISQQEFDGLLKKGELRRVTWYWCDEDYNLQIGEYEEPIDYGVPDAEDD